MTGISGETRIYAVIADPVFQLRTPEIINPMFRRRGANIIAIPVHVSSTDLPQMWSALRTMRNLAGIGVAMPHKAAAVKLCDRLDSTAASIRVVSAVRKQRDGTCLGAALDGRGFVAGLRGAGHMLAGKRVLMIGAGGAATANAFALVQEEIQSLTIVNRDAQRARSLADRVNEHCGRVLAQHADIDLSACDIVINATSLGLRPTDALPLDPSTLEARHLVVDLIARPPITRFLEAARSKGCAIHTGVLTIESHLERVVSFICDETQ